MGQYFIPTIFRKESNISELYARYDENPNGYTPVTEAPVAALLSHNFRFRCKSYDGRNITLGIGLKFMEHCYVGNLLCRAMEHLLANEYAGCPVVWGGDYSEFELFTGKTMNGETKAVNAYMLDDDELTTRTYDGLPTRRGYNRWHRYLINEDTCEFVKIPRCDSKEYQIHPLPVLTCDSYTNGLDDNPMVGMWRGHHLSVSNELPPSWYKELIFDYKEPEY